MIVYRAMPNGDFVIGDDATGRTARLYRKTPHAHLDVDEEALWWRRRPEEAAKIILGQTSYFKRNKHTFKFDSDNWKDLRG